MDRDTIWEVWDGLGHNPGGPGQVGTPSGRSGTSRDTLREVWTGRDTLREVRDVLVHTLGGLRWVGTPCGRSGTGRD